MIKKQKAVAYARFSPRPNASECESCESQIKDIREWCRRRKIEIVSEHSDKSVSGSESWDDRPGMFDAARHCKNGYLLIVRSFDRLFRSLEKSEMFNNMMLKRGVQIVSISEESASEDTPISNLIRRILSSFAEFQKEMTRAKTRIKMRQYQREGRKMSSIPPYGYKNDMVNEGMLAKDEKEYEIIQYIKKLYTEHGLSLREIGRLLDSKGIHNRAKSKWNHNLISKILKREGIIKDNKAEIKKWQEL